MTWVPTVTDNRPGALEAKVKLRRDWLDKTGKAEVRILDCFGGDGVIWAQIQSERPDVKIWRTGIEKTRGKGDPLTTLYGDNLNYLPNVELDSFDAIDLDSYGWPCEQLAIIADRAPQLDVFVTVGIVRMGAVPRDVVEAAGIPWDWTRKAQFAVTQCAIELWDNYCAGLGYTEVVRVVSKPVKGQVTMLYDHLFPMA